MNANLFDRLERSIAAPPKTAIATSAGETISYADLIALSGRLANVLVARGVKPGDRVAVQVEKSVPALVLYLATVRAGAVYLPLNTAYTLAELEYFISDAEPSLVVCDPGKWEGVQQLAAKVGAAVETLDAQGLGSLIKAADDAAEAFTTVQRAGDDLAAILYTSGTTGRSKGAMLTHDNLVSNAQTLIKFWRFTADDVLIHALPIYHTHGLFVASNVILFSGASMIFLPKFDADEILRLMPRATALMGVPTFYVRLLQHPGLTKDATSGMRLFVSGSAPLLAETHREWSARTGHAILERYGMTETNMNTSNPYDGDRVPGAVGLPLPGVSLRVADPETGRVRGTGEIGVIEVKGPNVFKGYWRMPEKTASEFRPDGFFITGDLGKIDERGYVHIVGRGKDLIITGGFNVYPKEIEDEIDAIPGVFESAVIGVPHKDLGEGITAVVVRSKEARVDEAAILTALDGRLARFKLPKRVIFVDELPRNTMGKVQKNVLRQQFVDLYVSPTQASQSAR
ncbi:malonate--CoA ligase [Microvirga makkahensis]|uniref:3-methylmercaptopropionyl-CoA ligase n=1 Tax=Microvirga makkahensis TaxID=1128670 RepID=A0A7X3MRZ8_9HYPH|nr:malonyl-CoA synthase [Microvirga makkahensis]MXQ12147.1 AMP-binding protein [Microvirga makkahensis]